MFTINFFDNIIQSVPKFLLLSLNFALIHNQIMNVSNHMCINFEELRSVKDHPHHTFREACEALGLLTDDREFVDSIHEASELGYGYYIRALFVRLLLSNTIANPLNVWKKTWKMLVDGIGI